MSYRFILERRWDTGNTMPLVWCMLNPSTADETQDDPTIRKCIGFSKRAGFSSLIVVNLCPWRATDPKALFAAQAAGADVMALDENRAWLEGAARQGPVVAAWGANFKPWMRPALEAGALPLKLWCLGLTKAGAPRHPLMVPYSQPLVQL